MSKQSESDKSQENAFVTIGVVILVILGIAAWSIVTLVKHLIR